MVQTRVKTNLDPRCTNKFFLPNISAQDVIIKTRINSAIDKVASKYGGCNNFDIHYMVPDSGDPDYFSVILYHSIQGEKIKILGLNFNKRTGKLLEIKNIFKDLRKLEAAVPDTIKLLVHKLPKTERNQEIQFYLEEGNWHIVANNKKIIDFILPKSPY